MPLRTECAKQGCVAPAVILLRAKLWCAKCAVAIHYPSLKDTSGKQDSTTKNNKQTTRTV